MHEQGPKTASRLRIPIHRGHIRGAIRAANAVYAASRSAPSLEPQEGFVLMTALLLVERLSTAEGCEPKVMLSKLADCFEVKRAYEAALDRRMLT